MASDESHLLPTLAAVHLGDIVRLHDGRALPATSRVMLPTPVGQMAGFVLCGEFEALIGFPLLVSSPYVLYRRVGNTPPEGILARARYSGVTNYWAPHLPAAGTAMGEILWRVAEVAGSVDPMVVLWRSEETSVFVRDGDVDPRQLGVDWMPRDQESDQLYGRESSQTSSPVRVPSPAGVPVHAAR